jgi:hypothetical protein
MSTIIDKRPPWMTYAASLDERLDSRLQAEVDEYSKHRHEKTSEQNAEELARWEEENKILAKQYQFLTPDEYKDEGARIGKIIHSSSFLNNLRQLGLNCHYREHPHKDKLTLIVIRNQKTEVGCWVARGFMPEYSIVRFDRHDVPLNEKFRGWRTCTLQLILKGLLDEKEVDAFFGKASGPASERYLSTLYNVRNRQVLVV